MYENWFIVKKGFNSGSELLTTGNPVDTSEWRNARSLEEAGYIRKPNGEDDINKIREAVEATNLKENKEIKEEPAKGSSPVSGEADRKTGVKGNAK